MSSRLAAKRSCKEGVQVILGVKSYLHSLAMVVLVRKKGVRNEWSTTLREDEA